MLNSTLHIRAAMPGDIPHLLSHMRALAEFEHYINDFTVDEKALSERAFGLPPECHIFVAEYDDGIIGYAVGVIIPFTYDLKSTLVLKEFFVDSGYRGKGAGSALFCHVAAWADMEGCGQLKWDVMAGNQRAEAFYKKHGGCPDTKWIPYVMGPEALKAAAQRHNDCVT